MTWAAGRWFSCVPALTRRSDERIFCMHQDALLPSHGPRAPVALCSSDSGRAVSIFLELVNSISCHKLNNSLRGDRGSATLAIACPRLA